MFHPQPCCQHKSNEAGKKSPVEKGEGKTTRAWRTKIEKKRNEATENVISGNKALGGRVAVKSNGEFKKKIGTPGKKKKNQSYNKGGNPKRTRPEVPRESRGADSNPDSYFSSQNGRTAAKLKKITERSRRENTRAS